LALSSVSDLEKAVEQCKEMVLDSAECSDERKWLVRRLIELRLRLQEMKEASEYDETSRKATKVVFGHHFILQNETSARTKYHCDRCAGIIWSVVHSWYCCAGEHSPRDCHCCRDGNEYVYVDRGEYKFPSYIYTIDSLPPAPILFAHFQIASTIAMSNVYRRYIVYAPIFECRKNLCSL
jgi:hypothetical protein